MLCSFFLFLYRSICYRLRAAQLVIFGGPREMFSSDEFTAIKAFLKLSRGFFWLGTWLEGWKFEDLGCFFFLMFFYFFSVNNVIFLWLSLMIWDAFRSKNMVIFCWCFPMMWTSRFTKKGGCLWFWTAAYPKDNMIAPQMIRSLEMVQPFSFQLDMIN